MVSFFLAVALAILVFAMAYRVAAAHSPAKVDDILRKLAALWGKIVSRLSRP